MKQVTKLEDTELWKMVAKIATDAYEAVQMLPKEEEWDMKARLHQHAFMATNHVAEAYGSLDPRDAKWLLGKARGNLFGVRNAYALAYKTGELGEKAEMMVLINQAAKLIDSEPENMDADIQAWYESLRDKTGQQKATKA